MNFNGDTLQHNNEFMIIIFCYLIVPVITMCNLIERFSLDCRETKTKVNTLANQRA